MYFALFSYKISSETLQMTKNRANLDDMDDENEHIVKETYTNDKFN